MVAKNLPWRCHQAASPPLVPRIFLIVMFLLYLCVIASGCAENIPRKWSQGTPRTSQGHAAGGRVRVSRKYLDQDITASGGIEGPSGAWLERRSDKGIRPSTSTSGQQDPAFSNERGDLPLALWEHFLKVMDAKATGSMRGVMISTLKGIYNSDVQVTTRGKSGVLYFPKAGKHQLLDLIWRTYGEWYVGHYLDRTKPSYKLSMENLENFESQARDFAISWLSTMRQRQEKFPPDPRIKSYPARLQDNILEELHLDDRPRPDNKFFDALGQIWNEQKSNRDRKGLFELPKPEAKAMTNNFAWMIYTQWYMDTFELNSKPYWDIRLKWLNYRSKVKLLQQKSPQKSPQVEPLRPSAIDSPTEEVSKARSSPKKSGEAVTRKKSAFSFGKAFGIKQKPTKQLETTSHEPLRDSEITKSLPKTPQESLRGSSKINLIGSKAFRGGNGDMGTTGSPKKTMSSSPKKQKLESRLQRDEKTVEEPPSEAVTQASVAKVPKEESKEGAGVPIVRSTGIKSTRRTKEVSGEQQEQTDLSKEGLGGQSQRTNPPNSVRKPKEPQQQGNLNQDGVTFYKNSVREVDPALEEAAIKSTQGWKHPKSDRFWARLYELSAKKNDRSSSGGVRGKDRDMKMADSSASKVFDKWSGDQEKQRMKNQGGDQIEQQVTELGGAVTESGTEKKPRKKKNKNLGTQIAKGEPKAALQHKESLSISNPQESGDVKERQTTKGKEKVPEMSSMSPKKESTTVPSYPPKQKTPWGIEVPWEQESSGVKRPDTLEKIKIADNIRFKPSSAASSPRYGATAIENLESCKNDLGKGDMRVPLWRATRLAQVGSFFQNFLRRMREEPNAIRPLPDRPEYKYKADWLRQHIVKKLGQELESGGGAELGGGEGGDNAAFLQRYSAEINSKIRSAFHADGGDITDNPEVALKVAQSRRAAMIDATVLTGVGYVCFLVDVSNS